MFKHLTLTSALALAITTSVVSGSQAAETILYRSDAVIGTDYLGEAINSGLYTVTTTSGSISGFTLSNYNIVVYSNQNLGIPAGDLAQLNAYIAAGGRVIFDDWTGSNGFNGDQNFTGETNQTSLTLSMFNSGVTSPLAVTNTSWAIFSTSMSALAGGTIGGTFGDGSGAIIVGNGGDTIVNGFLSDTVASEQLYANELASFATVPEPSTWALMLAGFAGLVVAGARARKTGAAAA